MISSTSFTPAGGRHGAVDLVVHHHDRREAARAEARDRFHGEQHVVGGDFLAFELEALADGVENRNGILHVARRAVAQADEVLALRLNREVRIKRGDAENARRRNVQRRGDVG